MPSELRTDVLTGRQVIVAPNRSARPGASSNEPPLRAGLNDGDPFLEGHESETPHESLALRTTASLPDQPGWLVRVVPNRYPAVCFDSTVSLRQSRDAAANWQSIGGVHEVVVECPDSRSRLADLTVGEIARILFAWKTRIDVLAQLDAIEFISAFRNQGFSAGASLPHSHSQIVGVDDVPPQVQERVRRADRFLRDTGEELNEHVLSTECESGQRIIAADDDLVVYCPFASRVAHHVRWVPRKHHWLPFSGLGEVELAALAASLLSVARAIDELTHQAATNLALIMPPPRHESAFRWMLDLLPRTSRIAGFEMLTDVDILTVAPETAAAELRDCIVWQSAPDFRTGFRPPGYEWRT